MLFRLRTAIYACASAILALASCSTMPDQSYPPHLDHDFGASFLIGDDGRLPFLETSTDLVLHRLELTPPPREERFGDGTRWFVYAPGTTVTVRGALRAYQTDEGTIPELEDLLQTPAARMISLTNF